VEMKHANCKVIGSTDIKKQEKGIADVVLQ
jgi:hypothetical protein